MAFQPRGEYNYSNWAIKAGKFTLLRALFSANNLRGERFGQNVKVPFNLSQFQLTLKHNAKLPSQP
jgi:hypothetical protein